MPIFLCKKINAEVGSFSCHPNIYYRTPIKRDDKGNIIYNTSPDGKGTAYYPIINGAGQVTYNTQPDGKGEEVQGSIHTSVQVDHNLPSINDAKVLREYYYQLENAEPALPIGNVENINHAPISAELAANLLRRTLDDGSINKHYLGNHAASIGDVLNAGWNIRNNGDNRDFLRPYDTVNFVDGANTSLVVDTDKAHTTTNVSVHVTGLPVATTLEIGGKTVPVVKVGDAYYEAKPDGSPMMSRDDKNQVTNGYVRAIDGKLYARHDVVASTENNVTTYRPKESADGDVPNQPKDLGTIAVKLVNPNVTDGISDNGVSDGKSLTTATTLGNVAKGTKTITDEGAHKGLADLETSTETNVATVGDLKNLGFVIGTSDNGYTDQIHHNTAVNIKGGNGISVTGETTKDGVREITVAIKEGVVTNHVTITSADGKTTVDAVKIGDKYYKIDENGKPIGYEVGKDGKPSGAAITIKQGDTIKNDGEGFVTGNTVAEAIHNIGFAVGKASEADVKDVTFTKEAKTYDKVNPDDEIKFVDGSNVSVTMATVKGRNDDGSEKAITYVKADMNPDINLTSITLKDEQGNTSISNGRGTEVTDKDKNTFVTSATGTTITDKDNNKVVTNATGMTVSDKDNNKLVTGATGTTITDKDNNKVVTNATGMTVSDKDNNKLVTGATGTTITDKDKNTVTTDAKGTTITDKDKNSLSTNATSTTIVDKDKNKTVTTATSTTITDKDNNQSVANAKGMTVTTHDGKSFALTGGDVILSTKESTDQDGHVTPATTTKVEAGGLSIAISDIKDKEGKITTPGSNLSVDGRALTITKASHVDDKGNIHVGHVTTYGDTGLVIRPIDPSTGKVLEADDPRTTSFSSENISAGMQQIHNVAPGESPTDAVNMSQLHDMTSNVKNEVYQAGARAAALAALKPLQYDPLEPTQIMAGMGNYKGKTAGALGVAHFTREDTMFHVGVTLSGHDNMVNAGVTRKFGWSDERKSLPDRYQAGPISSTYVMQDEVAALKAENVEQKQMIQSQQEQINELRKMVEQLIQSK